MMRPQLIMVGLLCTFVVACAKSGPGPKLDVTQAANAPATPNIPKPGGPSAGGQPGMIRVLGAPIYMDKSVDEAITAKFESGRGENGFRAITTAGLVVAHVPEQADLEWLKQAHTLITLGCDQKWSEEFALEQGLDLLNVDLRKQEGPSQISAQVIALCGNIDAMRTKDLLLNSDMLILGRVSYTRTGAGTFTMNTNRLQLVGQNNLKLKATDGSLDAAPTMTVNVVRQLLGDTDAKLRLTSVGANYAAPTR